RGAWARGALLGPRVHALIVSKEGPRMRHPLTLLTREVRPLDLRVENTCLLMQDLHAPFADPVEGWFARRAREKVLLPEFRDYFETLALVAANLPRLLAAARS